MGDLLDSKNRGVKGRFFAALRAFWHGRRCRDCVQYHALLGKRHGMCTLDYEQQIRRRGCLRCVPEWRPPCGGFLAVWTAEDYAACDAAAHGNPRAQRLG